MAKQCSHYLMTSKNWFGFSFSWQDINRNHYRITSKNWLGLLIVTVFINEVCNFRLDLQGCQLSPDSVVMQVEMLIKLK